MLRVCLTNVLERYFREKRENYFLPELVKDNPRGEIEIKWKTKILAIYNTEI